MIAHLALLPDVRAMRRVDIAVVLFVAVFGVLGLVAGQLVGELAHLSASLLSAADAIEATSRGVALLTRLPFVGDGAARLSGSIAAAAMSVRTAAMSSSATIANLAVALGLAVALMPSLPVIAVYAPLRVARWRQLRALRRLVRGQPDSLLVEQLARQATLRLPLGELRRVSPSPWQDLAEGRHHCLAAAELRRLGLAVPPDWLGGR